MTSKYLADRGAPCAGGAAVKQQPVLEHEQRRCRGALGRAREHALGERASRRCRIGPDGVLEQCHLLSFPASRDRV